MRLRNTAISIVIICSTLVAVASEEQRNKNDYYYAQLNLGYARSQKPQGGFQGNLNHSPVYGIETGLRLNEYFRTSLSLDYRPNFKNNYSTTSGYISNFIPYTITDTYNTKVKSLAVMLNAYYDITEVNNLTPYLTLAGGVSSNKTSSSINKANSLGASYAANYNTAVHNNFAYKAGLGIRFTVSKVFDMDLRYQYVNLGKFKTGALTGSGGSTAAAPRTGKLISNEFLLGVVYKF